MKVPSISVNAKHTSFPVIQGGMAVRISMAPLTAAVANAGGIGVIGASGMSPDELAREILLARGKTSGIIGVNVMVALHRFRQLVEVAMDKKADLVIAGAGISRDLFKWTKNRIPVFSIVSSARVALSSARLGAAGVIVESGQAGGHLGTEPGKTVWEILPEVVKVLRENSFFRVAVVAAGGILKGGDIVRALKGGASGVQIGTRFALTDESSADWKWKETVANAREEDTAIIESPVEMMGRAVRTPFVEKILAGRAEAPTSFEKCKVCLGQCTKKYCLIEALEKAQEGDVEEGIFFCGSRVGEINDVVPVREVFRRLKDEYALATGHLELGAAG